MEKEKVIEVAKSYLGCKKGSKKHKKLIDAFNKVKPDGYTAKVTDPWCAEAVSAWFILAYGKKNAVDMLGLSASCPRMIEKAKRRGIWIESDKHKPKIGELVMYDWDDSGKGDNTGSPDHVGLVTEVTKNDFTVIEGNKGNTSSVAYRTMKVNGRYIRGYIKPLYNK